MNTTSEARQSTSTISLDEVSVDGRPELWPDSKSTLSVTQLDCTNVPNDPIALALDEAKQAWLALRDHQQLRRVLLGVLALLN